MKIDKEIKKVTKSTTVYSNARCDRCDASLLPAWAGAEGLKDGETTELEFKGALELCIKGGYYGYFDAMTEPIIYCGKCADKLIMEFPSFGRVIKEAEES